MELGLLGEHQAANAAVAVACVEELREQGWRIDDDAVASGLADVRWPARMEIVGRKPFIVLDCAHNVASVEALVETLLSSFPPARRWLIFAGSGDKELAGMFQVLAPHFQHAFLTRYQNSPRGVTPEDLAHLLARSESIPFTLCRTPAEALAAARMQAGVDDLVCITGSVFLAGEMRPMLVPV
jgi:dihydrofolate synthase/folylpolyglutamate synthase